MERKEKLESDFFFPGSWQSADTGSPCHSAAACELLLRSLRLFHSALLTGSISHPITLLFIRFLLCLGWKQEPRTRIVVVQLWVIHCFFFFSFNVDKLPVYLTGSIGHTASAPDVIDTCSAGAPSCCFCGYYIRPEWMTSTSCFAEKSCGGCLLLFLFSFFQLPYCKWMHEGSRGL